MSKKVKLNILRIIKQEYNVMTGNRKTWVEIKPTKKPKSNTKN